MRTKKPVRYRVFKSVDMSDGDEGVCRLCASEVADGQRLFAGDKGGADDAGCADVMRSFAADLSKVQSDQPRAKFICLHGLVTVGLPFPFRHHLYLELP